MRTLVFVVAGLCALTVLARRPENSDRRLSDAVEAKPFRSGHEYSFRYDAQVATGLSPKASDQKAATRLEAKVKLAFRSNDKAILRMEDIRFGQRNDEMYQPHEMQPMRIFEQKPVSDEQERQLHLPAQITIEEGVVKRINFHKEDAPWSKNVKRGVINLVQINLKRQNAEESNERDESEPASCSNDQTSCAFTLKEITLEGKCTTTYTLNKAGQKQSSSGDKSRFNVTKAIDFQQCSEVADVAYGFDSQEIQPECTFQTDAEEDQKTEKKLPHGARCDPKEVKQEKIDRTTVYRYTLQGKPESEYGIERATVLSQYTVKNLNAEQHKAVHHITVLAELVYEDDSQASSKATSDSGIASKTETLLYNAEREVQEKRFFMNGDEEFGRQSPFEQVPNKAGLAKKIAAHMIAGWTQNIDTEVTLHFSRLVDVLRMSTVSELQKIWKMLVEGKSGMGLKAEQQERLEQILQDALAAAGTRNTIHLLVEKVIKEEIPAGKAVHALKMLTSVPAPSQKLIKQIERLCKSETSDKNGPLKQACWLTYGSLVADLCREKPVKVQMPNELRTEERCTRDVKDQFKSTLMQQYKSADSTYEKILALKALGNAALDIAVHELEEIYKNLREETTVRMQASLAIDSLRRLRTQMPHRIHRSLMPLFENTREQPEVRMAAFAMIMHTVPEKAVLDQITYALLHERSENVKSFVYTTAKTLVNSNIPSEKELGQHLDNALKLAKVEPSTMRASRQYNVPIYSQAEREGLVFGMSSMFSTRNALPAHIAARVDGLLNNQLKRNALEVQLSQRDVERWYEKAVELLGESAQRPTRGQRSQRRGAEELRSFYSEQGYKSRRSGNEKEEPFGMLCVRILDVDHVILPVTEELMPRILKDALRGDKPKISDILRAIPEEAKHFRMSAAMLFAEKQVTIPTSVGLPLRLRQSLPILSAVHGSVQLQLNGARPKAQLSMQTVATPVYEQKVEVWTPIVAAGTIRRESIELNLPVDVQGQADKEQLKVTVKLPQDKHVLAVVRTLPATYTDETSEKSEPEREPQLKTIHSPRVEHLYREMKQELGKSIDVPVVVRAHYHAPGTVDYRGVVDAWKNTPNTIRVEYEPTSETPEKLELQASWSLFEKAASGKLELNDFFRETKFNEVYSSEETDSMDLDDQNDRNRKLNSFIDSNKPKGMYKHNIKLSAKTIGGRRQHSASVEVNGECEPRMTYCKVDLKADTSRNWQVTAQAKVLLPETVKGVSELERLSEKQKHFVAQLRAEWNQPEKQEVRVSIQGEPAMTRQQRKVEQELARHNPAYKALTAFVNKYDLEASYTLSSQAQNVVNKAYEAVKTAYFWQSNAELKEGRDGTVHISAIIDPITRRHVNVTVKTPSQRLRISSIDLPANTRPLPFVRRQSTPMHSLRSIVSTISNGMRAECRITDEKVRTFDDVVYRSALPKCFAAVAKDCSGDEPRFAVYMKRISQDSQEKKLKVITEDQIIEVKPKGDVLVIKVNDERLDEDWEAQARHGIYVNSEQQEAVIDVNGIQVHFNGEEATISVSPLYKNGVCGLCGHYDGEREDELRMKNNEHASDLEEFHRSYVHQTDDECTKEEFDAFYSKQTFQQIRSAESNDEWDMDEFFENGRPQRSQSMRKWRKQDRSSEEKPEPIEATEIMEYHEKMCFTTKPVKKCPRGTEPESTSEKSVPFKCYQRGSMNAQRMLKKARNGDLLDELHDEEPSFSHSVKVPRTCVDAY